MHNTLPHELFRRKQSAKISKDHQKIDHSGKVSHLYKCTVRAHQTGTLSNKYPTGGKAVGWIEEEVDTVIRAMITGADKSSLEQLVARLISERNERFRI